MKPNPECKNVLLLFGMNTFVVRSVFHCGEFKTTCLWIERNRCKHFSRYIDKSRWYWKHGCNFVFPFFSVVWWNENIFIFFLKLQSIMKQSIAPADFRRYPCSWIGRCKWGHRITLKQSQSRKANRKTFFSILGHGTI